MAAARTTAVARTRQTEVLACFVFAVYNHYKHPKYLGGELNRGQRLSQN